MYFGILHDIVIHAHDTADDLPVERTLQFDDDLAGRSVLSDRAVIDRGDAAGITRTGVTDPVCARINAQDQIFHRTRRSDAAEETRIGPRRIGAQRQTHPVPVEGAEEGVLLGADGGIGTEADRIGAEGKGDALVSSAFIR